MANNFNFCDRLTDKFSRFMPTVALVETYPRHLGNTNQNLILSGWLGLVGIDLPAGLTVTSITFRSATTALSAGTNQWFSLYNSALGKLAVTSDDTSTAWAANTSKSLSLTTPFVTTYSGIHYLGITVVASTTPTLAALASAGTALLLVSPGVAGVSNTGLTNPASAPATAQALGAIGGIPYAYVS